MNRKQRIKYHNIVRRVIQVIFFLWMPALYSSAYSAVKYVFGQIKTCQPIEFNGFVVTFLVLCGFTIVFGRFFCGYACAFGATGDFFYEISAWIQKKLTKSRKKKVKLPWFPTEVSKKLQKIKYVVLLGLIAIYALDLSDKFAGTSPWEVFSLLYNRNLPSADSVIGVILLLLIIIGMCLKERFFCQYLCPMGAIFSWLPVLPFSVLDRNREDCLKGCKACQTKCPVDLEIKRDQRNGGECIHCLQCMDVCPKQNIHLVTGKKVRGNEIPAVIAKAVLLAVICFAAVSA